MLAGALGAARASGLRINKTVPALITRGGRHDSRPIRDPEEDITSERDVPIYLVGTYVPTREEVRSMTPQRLHALLDQWMWQSPALLILNNGKISDVIAIPEHCADAATRAVPQILANCRRYVAS